MTRRMVVIPWEEYQRLSSKEVSQEREEVDREVSQSSEGSDRRQTGEGVRREEGTQSGEAPRQEEAKLTIPTGPPPGIPAVQWLKWK